MDPLSALSVAAAAVQFFEFASKILRASTKGYRDGKGVDFEAIEKTLEDLIDLEKGLNRPEKLQLGQGAEETITKQEKALEGLYSECRTLAVELVNMLQQISKKKMKKGHKWNSFRQAILSVWNEGRIKALEESIGLYRNQLVTRLLSYLSVKMDLYAAHNQDQLQKLDTNDAEIMKVITFTQDQVLSETRKNHQEVVSALFTLTNGETRTMALPERSQADLLDASQAISVDLKAQSMLAFQKGRSITKSGAQPIQQAVLDCLQYRHIRDRFETAQGRHRDTLDWIYCDPVETKKPWSNFREWLASEEQQIYWINGKPGSGKTTLMKYISQESRTMDGLNDWADEGKLVSASFFFWNLGPFEIQKSQAGLLRSLLHDILSQAPSLIPIVMPELCLDIVKSKEEVASGLFEPPGEGPNKPSRYIGDPTLPELHRWFRRLLQQANAKLRFCCLIDGLDEYVGDFRELINIILGEVKASPWIKFVISSRPIIPCTEMFSSFPGLRLQDLNYGDIRQYATDMLQPKLSLLADDVGSQESLLIEELTSKSSGVFLWVVLVVKSLIEGLENGDRLSELRERLKQLPSDLAELYYQMFDKIDGSYRRQASKIFRILLQGLEYEAERDEAYPLSAFMFSYAEHSWSEVSSAPFSKMTPQKIARRCAEVDRRLRSRCCGLIEINQRTVTDPLADAWCEGQLERGSHYYVPSSSEKGVLEQVRVAQSARLQDRVVIAPVMTVHDGKSLGEPGNNAKIPPSVPCVEFIHRSVVEFLREPSVSAILYKDTEHGTDPRTCLLFAHMLWLKAAPRDQIFGLGNSCTGRQHFHGVMRTTLRDIAEAESCKRPFPLDYLNELDRILQSHWNAAKFAPYTSGPFRYFAPANGHWAQSLFFVASPIKDKRSSATQNSVGEMDMVVSETTPKPTHLNVIGPSQKFLDEINDLGLARIAAALSLKSFIEVERHSEMNNSPTDPNIYTRLLESIVRSKTEMYLVQYHMRREAQMIRDSGWWGQLTFEGIGASSCIAIIQHLLNRGADPNHIAEQDEASVWIRYLQITPILRYFAEDVGDFARPFRDFISHGSDTLEICANMGIVDGSIHHFHYVWLKRLGIKLGTNQQMSKWQPRTFSALSFLEILFHHQVWISDEADDLLSIARRQPHSQKRDEGSLSVGVPGMKKGKGIKERWQKLFLL